MSSGGPGGEAGPGQCGDGGGAPWGPTPPTGERPAGWAHAPQGPFSLRSMGRALAVMLRAPNPGRCRRQRVRPEVELAADPVPPGMTTGRCSGREAAGDGAARAGAPSTESPCPGPGRATWVSGAQAETGTRRDRCPDRAASGASGRARAPQPSARPEAGGAHGVLLGAAETGGVGSSLGTHSS